MHSTHHNQLMVSQVRPMSRKTSYHLQEEQKKNKTEKAFQDYKKVTW